MNLIPNTQRTTYPFRKGHKYNFYVDVETTGFDPVRNDIISICIVVTDKKFNILEKYYSTIKPNMNHWTEGAAEIHGFTKEEAVNFDEPRTAAIKILNFLKPYKDENNRPQLFVCHANSKKFWDAKKNNWSWAYFDYWFVYFLFYKLDLNFSFLKVFSEDFLVSTIKLGREEKYKKNSLDVWAERIGFPLKHHDAESDTLCCLYVHRFFETGEVYAVPS